MIVDVLPCPRANLIKDETQKKKHVHFFSVLFCVSFCLRVPWPYEKRGGVGRQKGEVRDLWRVDSKPSFTCFWHFDFFPSAVSGPVRQDHNLFVGWLIGWMTGWLIGCWAGWLVVKSIKLEAENRLSWL